MCVYVCVCVRGECGWVPHLFATVSLSLSLTSLSVCFFFFFALGFVGPTTPRRPSRPLLIVSFSLIPPPLFLTGVPRQAARLPHTFLPPMRAPPQQGVLRCDITPFPFPLFFSSVLAACSCCWRDVLSPLRCPTSCFPLPNPPLFLFFLQARTKEDAAREMYQLGIENFTVMAHCFACVCVCVWRLVGV